MRSKLYLLLKAFFVASCLLFFYASYSAAQCSQVPLQEAIAAVAGDAEVAVSTVTVGEWGDPNYYYEFIPVNVTPTGALILYSGADIDVRAYAPLAKDIAAAGYLVVLMSNCTCVVGFGRADTIIDLYPEINNWSIGGHSLGGVCGGWYIQDGINAGAKGLLNTDKIKGFVLWDTTPPDSMLSYGIKAISIYRTTDNEPQNPDIVTTQPLLPDNTIWIGIEGANHEQFGWYGDNETDYDYIRILTRPSATISREAQQDIIVDNTISFLDSLNHIPEAFDFFAVGDGSAWERVNIPGFDSADNFSVVAMAPYHGQLYAMTRNEAEGAEVWRTNGTEWEQVLFPGEETNGVYGNTRLNNVWGKIIEFNDKLYFSFSSGLQGSVLGSTGCELWRYDGVNWEPVISDRKDIDEAGLITAISDCADADSSTTAVIEDNTKSWTPDQWAGGTLQIVSGPGITRKFDIVGNTSSSLTIQQNETAGTGADPASESEFTFCGEKTFKNFFPKHSYTLGAISAGDQFEIGLGKDESGFGDFWNKTITDMIIFEGKLYVSTGLNYDYGAQIWSTVDGDNWTVTQAATGNGPLENSFGNYHVDSDYPGGVKSVSTSLTSMTVFNGTLYSGGTGSTGASGKCARMAKMTGSGWELIVDGNIDVNTTGTNENGFGDGMTCAMDTGNFMPWSISTFNGMLMAGINSLAGLRVLYSETGSADDTDGFGDPTWKYSIGGDSPYAEGFGDPDNQILLNLYPYDGVLYGGAGMTHVPAYGMLLAYGAPLVKSSDGLVWEEITVDGFADNDTVMMEGFAEFEGTLYVSASKGASSSSSGLGGAKIYRMAIDSDGDNVADILDNCPDLENSNQEDTDSDGSGDVCDADSVYGYIYESGAALENVTVRIYRPNCGGDIELDSDMTDSEGYYSFGNIGAGRRTIAPELSGYTFEPEADYPKLPQDEIISHDFTATAIPAP